MPCNEYEPEKYLSKRGRKIFLDIVRHIKALNLIEDIDILELSMLSHSLCTYEAMAAYCNTHGFTEMCTGKNGTFKQAAPEYSIMKNEYTNFLKHSHKYGLTPGDRAKIFKGVKVKKSVQAPDDGLDD